MQGAELQSRVSSERQARVAADAAATQRARVLVQLEQRLGELAAEKDVGAQHIYSCVDVHFPCELTPCVMNVPTSCSSHMAVLALLLETATPDLCSCRQAQQAGNVRRWGKQC